MSNLASLGCRYSPDYARPKTINILATFRHNLNPDKTLYFASNSYSCSKITIALNSIREWSNVAAANPRKHAVELPPADLNWSNAKSLCYGRALISTLVDFAYLSLGIRQSQSWHIPIALSPTSHCHNIVQMGMFTGLAK